MACGTLAGNITANCDNPIVAGVGNTAYIINYDDWQEATVTAAGDNPLELTALTLASGDNIFKIETVAANAIRPRYDIARESGLVRFKHYVELRVERDDVATKEQVLQLNLGRFVIIVFTNSEQIEVLGADAGLTVEAAEQRNFYANQGSFLITFSSDDETLEPFIPKSYVGSSSPYDFATAKADITSQVSA